MKIVFFDLETTGTLVNKHGIHQISGEIVVDGEVKETFDFHVQPNPKAEITQEALDVAGVTKEQILAYPPWVLSLALLSPCLINTWIVSIRKISSFWQGIIMLILITSFSVPGFCKTMISILVLGSGVTV